MDFQPQTLEISPRENHMWFPIYTHALHEFRLYNYLREREIPVYLPVIPDFKIHNIVRNGRPYSYRKEVLRPMLKSYLFAQLNPVQKRNIWNSKSILKIFEVSEEYQPVFIEELRGLQMMEVLARSSKLEYKKEIQVNDRFVIESPREFEGIYGYLVQKQKRFLWVIKIELLGQFVNVEIDPCNYKMRKID
ncbi:MAG: hypothetical protein E7040_00200 [Lentisphaerae bacterium]|nr:hypothetical protein [Lentisphaerota bacterium]